MSRAVFVGLVLVAASAGAQQIEKGWYQGQRVLQSSGYTQCYYATGGGIKFTTIVRGAQCPAQLGVDPITMTAYDLATPQFDFSNVLSDNTPTPGPQPSRR